MTRLDTMHGPRFLPQGGVEFRLWAPRHQRVSLRWRDEKLPMARDGDGFFRRVVPDARPGEDYAFLFEEGRVRPDPASRRQPQGVHQASRLFDPSAHVWRHPFRGQPLEELVFYELHVGTFTPAGTLDAAVERLSDLADLGVSCVELMPVQPFPGARNWGYDGVYPYGVSEAYGGPEALQRFVDRAHDAGLAVCLDVVFNHLGPEGNYLTELGPYFTPRHKSPWGDGVNFDGPDAGPVRAFMVDAALQWVRDFRVDALRLDAVHAITDDSPRHLVREISDALHAFAHQSGRDIQVIAESDLNDRKVVSADALGWSCDAMWADDLHHGLHTLLTGESASFFCDFQGTEPLARALSAGFHYRGQYSAYRKGKHGTSTEGLSPKRFVVCSQNHDQVGNRPRGERLSALLPFEALEPIAALVVLAGPLPLLFMGEEYGETRPFLYFTSHSDPDLARAVSEGRKNEFIAAGGHGTAPDPQAPATHEESALTHRRDGRHGALRKVYQRLLGLRAEHRALLTESWPQVTVEGKVFTLRRPGFVLQANLGPNPASGLAAWEWRAIPGGTA